MWMDAVFAGSAAGAEALAAMPMLSTHQDVVDFVVGTLLEFGFAVEVDADGNLVEIR